MLPPKVDETVSTSGASPLTTIDSCTADTDICRLTTAICPTCTTTAFAAVPKPASSAVTRYSPMRIGMR